MQNTAPIQKTIAMLTQRMAQYDTTRREIESQHAVRINELNHQWNRDAELLAELKELVRRNQLS